MKGGYKNNLGRTWELVELRNKECAFLDWLEESVKLHYYIAECLLIRAGIPLQDRYTLIESSNTLIEQSHHSLLQKLE